MVIKKISLRNFRLHSDSEIDFSEKLNYIVGGNGHGKTSILEAVYYLCTTKNINLNHDSDSVNFNEKELEIIGQFKDLTENNVRLQYSLNTSKKNYFLDDKLIYRASTIIGKFPVVTLTQLDHFITTGAPAERRKFVDSIISQASSTYLKILLEYKKVLRQRTSLLNQIRENPTPLLYTQLDSWNEALINSGTELIEHRIIFIKNYLGYVISSYQKIMGQTEIPEIEYKYFSGESSDSVEEQFRRELKLRREDELRRAKNLVGPHKDDFIFAINGFDLRKFGSQGQHKTFQIALRFGEFFYLKDTLGKTPIFLFDDVFGELDTFRANKISEYLTEVGQAIITMTDFSNLDKLSVSKSSKVIKVFNGEIAYA